MEMSVRTLTNTKASITAWRQLLARIEDTTRALKAFSATYGTTPDEEVTDDPA